MLRRLFWDSGLRSTRDGAILISQGRGVGGSTVHNLCYAVRPPQVSLGKWGVPEIWPHFGQVEQTLGVTQIQETDVNQLNAVIRRGCEAMKWSGTVQNTIAVPARRVVRSVFLDVLFPKQRKAIQVERVSRAWRLRISPWHLLRVRNSTANARLKEST